MRKFHKKIIVPIIFLIIVAISISTHNMVYASTGEINSSNDTLNIGVNGKIVGANINGKIVFIINRDPQAPKTEIITEKQKIIDTVMTSAERQAVYNGANINIWLEVKDIEKSITNEEVEKFTDSAASIDYTVGQYIDLRLLKKLSTENDSIRLEETSKPIQLELTIPEHLRNTNPEIQRTFMLARLYNGKIDFVPITMDYDTLVMNFETNIFSKYAILYKDTQLSNSIPVDDTSKTNNNTSKIDENSASNNSAFDDSTPKTGDNLPTGIYLLITVLSALVVIGIKNIKKA